MKVYCGTYHKYNCGSLAGEWIDLTDFTDKEDFLAYCAELHKDEPDPEFMFQDYEDIPIVFISESWVSEMLWEIPDDIDIDAFSAWVDNYGMDANDSELFDKFQDSFMGQWDSEEAFAENEFYELEAHNMPEHLIYYIDFEKYARDLFMNEYSYVGGYVFRDF